MGAREESSIRALGFWWRRAAVREPVNSSQALIARARAVHPIAGWVLAVAWIALIWHLSARAPTDLSHGSIVGSWLSNLAHGPEFAGLATWLALAARRPGTAVAPSPRAAFYIVAFCLLYGVVDELHQSTVPGRDASVFDILTDVCGATAAVTVLRAATDGRRLARVILLGLAACIAAAGLATFVPPMAPQIEWL